MAILFANRPLAATLLGAKVVIGCDNDSEAVRVSRERIACPAFAGSVDAVRSATADIIVANISSAVLEELAPEFARVRKPGSRLILSGFTKWDRVEGFDVKEWTEEREWACAVC